jgi:2-(1,2-epoxy-1,2-dihydrophenyl)acetyl-CoA isomerase
MHANEKPAEAPVLESLHNGIQRITLNRPEVANALLPSQRDRIIELLGAADRDPEVRVVVLDAAGKFFCSGADVATLAKAAPDGSGPPALRAGEGMQRLLNGAQRLITAVLDCSKPVIAVVQGTAAGLGAHLAFACDLVIASENAAFVEAFVLRGMAIDTAGAYLLTRRIGLQKAKELVFFGDKLSAADAAQLGLVNRVVASEALADAAAALAQRLAAAPTLAIGLSKRLLNRALDGDRSGALMEEAMAQEISSRSHDSGEGVRAFVERRTAQFKGY